MIDIKMLEEFPSLKHQYQQIIAMNFFKIFLNKEKKSDYRRLKNDFESLVTEMIEYNKNFSDKGWIIYDSINIEMVKKANHILKEKGETEAEKYIVNYYLTEVKGTINWLYNASPEFSIRRELIKKAIDKHFDKDYGSAILIFLTIADGIINDYTKSKGLFTDNVDLSCWDCLVGCNSGLKKIKGIYNSPRKKTNTEMIYFPYRNGILHGRDLVYDNEIVSSKCIVMLFAIRDWIVNKNNETTRKEKYQKEINPPSLSDSLKKYKKIQEDKKIIAQWKPENIEIGKDIPISGGKEEYKTYPYIYCVIEMLELWQKKNYGKLAEKLNIMFSYEENKNKRPKECRMLFEKNNLKGFKLLKIIDQAICMKVIEIYVETDKKSGNIILGVIYEGEDICALPQNNDGQWKIYPRDMRILY